jgi:hypothetical protein
MQFAGREADDDHTMPPLPPLPESTQPRVRAGSTAPSERTIQNLAQQQPGGIAVHPNRNIDIEHPDIISEARESFITLPPSLDTTSTHIQRGGRGARGVSGNNESSQTVSTWANVPGYLHDPTPQP